MDLKSFIKQQGFEAIAKKLDCSTQIVRDWYSLEKAPRPKMALRLIMLSNGVLDWEKVYKPFAQKELHKTSYVIEVNGMKSTLHFDFTKELKELGHI